MYTAEAGIGVIVVVFCTISQVMDRFHKKAYAYGRKHLLRNVWILINPSYTFWFLQTLRHSFDDRGEFGLTVVYDRISGQIFGLLSHLFYR